MYVYSNVMYVNVALPANYAIVLNSVEYEVVGCKQSPIRKLFQLSLLIEYKLKHKVKIRLMNTNNKKIKKKSS